MPNPTNEQIALWLDPERKRAEWWDHAIHCSVCGQIVDGPAGRESVCRWNSTEGEPSIAIAPTLNYTGPDFYLPGPCAEEVERLKALLEATHEA